MITILFTMSFLISWKLTLAAILPLPIMAALMTIYGKKIHERFIAAQDSFGDLNDKVLESVAGVRVIRAYVQERADEDVSTKMTEDVYVKNMKVAKIDSLFDPTIKSFNRAQLFDWFRLWCISRFPSNNYFRRFSIL